MDSSGSVTQWLIRLKEGEEDALIHLHDRYWPFLVGLARKRLGTTSRRAYDEEDVAQNAFIGFYETVKKGGFPQLNNRNDLLFVLSIVTARKAATQMEFVYRGKRTPEMVKGESALDGIAGRSNLVRGVEQLKGKEPTPEEELVLLDTYETLLSRVTGNVRTVAEQYIAGSTQAEIADALGISQRSVERKVAIIRNRLQELLTEDAVN